MKCRKCNQRAVINMRQHKLALCDEHFLTWVINQTERSIRKYDMFTHEDRVLIAVSGGKDSLALWDVLNRLGYQTAGFYVNLGIDDETAYSSKSYQLAVDFAQKYNLKLHAFQVDKTYGATIPEMAALSRRSKNKTCSICGLVKRHSFNKFAMENGFSVFVTGHNLDDEVAVLYNNTLSWQLDFLRRQAPVLPAKPGLLKKAKPFCRFYERETAAYALLRGIEYIEEECPYADGSTTIAIKTILNQLEHNHAGTKLAFYLKFLKAKPELFPQLGESLVPQDLLFTCPGCQQPTPKEGDCAFCRLISEVQTKKMAK